MQLDDKNERYQATDPSHSFIVQAPAGSGKTELLTQRYLRLLSTVTAPEHIIALTFTRKAASEMRERILQALTLAAHHELPISPHQQLTYTYAKKALAQSQRLNWQLLDTPNRLRIMTIDALCQWLSHAMPLYEREAPYASISDDPGALYHQAIRACLAMLLNDSAKAKSLATLLSHLDNRQDKLFNLLTNLLINREQWLTSLFAAKTHSKDNYEQALTWLIDNEVNTFCQTVPDDCRALLCSLSHELSTINHNQTLAYQPLSQWYEFDQINADIATSLSTLLLTKDNKLRKSFDHHVGLKTNSCDKITYQSLKKRSQSLLMTLANNAAFITAIRRLKQLPHRTYADNAWQVLQALLDVLPLLVAHLQLVFQAVNEVDFVAVANQAILALGEEHDPTDLALYLDYVIHHLLIDEFQDTSTNQFQLITKLVQGFLPDDGKTLFVVGDPMQSIYRFRQAEVGLFLQAQQQGIGPVLLTNLKLKTNFRSTPTLVAWVNHHFPDIFPIKNNVTMGAVSFYPAHSADITTGIESEGIFAQQYTSKASEAYAIVETIAQELVRYPEQKIALLVRSRHQLSAIMPLLRQRNIPFQGVEIERLANLSYLQDLFVLTKALLMPANRLAWLCLLRSPWVGLGLADLHKIANIDRKKSIFDALNHSCQLTDLTNEGRQRATFVYHVMHHALLCRHQQPLASWIMQVMQQLHGEQLLAHYEQIDLDQFWALLARFTKQGQIEHWQRFEAAFKLLYSERATKAPLQIMTIHKAKGLEFDCVILPSLGDEPAKPSKPLLRWLTLAPDIDFLLFSPIQAASEKECRLYNYLGIIEQEKEQFERQRLLYVAVTRAKKRLYLFDSHAKPINHSFRFLLKNQLFSSIFYDTTNLDTVNDLTLYRLPNFYYLNPKPLISMVTTPTSLTLQIPSYAQYIGIAAHELLQWLCDHHPKTLDKLPWNNVCQRFKRLGFNEAKQQQAQAQLYQSLTLMLDNPIGRWLCQPHEDEHNEYEILVEEQGRMVTRIIDRTFYYQADYWVIDFKTGHQDTSQQKAHYQQVTNYAKLLSAIKNLPVKCGLYYLKTNTWLHWSYDQNKKNADEQSLTSSTTSLAL